MGDYIERKGVAWPSSIFSSTWEEKKIPCSGNQLLLHATVLVSSHGLK